MLLSPGNYAVEIVLVVLEITGCVGSAVVDLLAEASVRVKGKVDSSP